MQKDRRAAFHQPDSFTLASLAIVIVSVSKRRYLVNVRIVRGNYKIKGTRLYNAAVCSVTWTSHVAIHEREIKSTLNTKYSEYTLNDKDIKTTLKDE